MTDDLDHAELYEECVAMTTRVRGGVSIDGKAERPVIHRRTRNEGSRIEVRLSPASNPAPSPYKSKWEAAYAAKLEMDKAAGIIRQYWYEPFSIWLPGKMRYKPDFMIERHSVNPWGGQMYPNIEIIEVKGWSKNRRDGMTRLKIAAALFPCFVWRMVYRTKGGGWDGEYV